MKILILHLTMVALGLAGCATTHYHERQSDRVIFYLRAPKAKGVTFVSSLDNFQLHSAQMVGNERWKVSVAASSEFKYFYIVDGAVYVPECRLYEKDDFGSRNCIYAPK